MGVPEGDTIYRAAAALRTALAVLGAVCAAIAVSGGIEWPTRVPSTVEWGMIAWIGVLGVAVAVILWNVGVSLVGVPVASLFSNSAPVFAIGVAALMGSEPSWLQLGGGALVLGAGAQLKFVIGASGTNNAITGNAGDNTIAGNGGIDRIFGAMEACIDRGMREDGILPGGLSVKRRARQIHQTILGRMERQMSDPLAAMDFVNLWAMAVNEENAAGGRVVTAPTNGAASSRSIARDFRLLRRLPSSLSVRVEHL